MSNQSFNVVIPARFGSTRFPGKVLHKIAGKPMLKHVHERALATGAEKVIVATDHQGVHDYCESTGMQVVMTSEKHESGTDRVAEVVDQFSWDDDAIVVCLQGDEPATPPAIVDQVAANLASNATADIATLCAHITDIGEYNDPNRVKVVFDNNGLALYFSRSPIPFRRESTDNSCPPAYVHVGIYAYRCHFLRTFSKLQPHVLEQEERLEQLRALGNGHRIHVAVSVAVPAHGVDTPSDIAPIEALLLKEQSS